jgi:putative SOS response-associated peptidase YedK
MCGRFVNTLTLEQMIELFRIHDRPNLEPTWNAAPTQALPIIRRGKNGEPRLTNVRWGLVPHWSKTGPDSGKPLINARGETAHEKPTFRQALERRRALIPADGFYEWDQNASTKTPYFITRKDGEPMVFAGVWERWGLGADKVDSFAILTLEANNDISHFHHRCPVMLERGEFDAWLDPANDARPFLKRVPDDSLNAQQVSKRVNTVKENDAHLIEPEGSDRLI